tara:strand:- start:138 stop:647 length:510 start_codon:yes stop_codon:yes gene_type:complete
MSSNATLEEQLKEFRNQYYQENKKATIFKNSQKFACAAEVTKKFTLNQLLEKSIYMNENKIIVNYPLIKTFINPNIYSNILQHFENLTTQILIKNDIFDIHLDMNTFTMTAAHRYTLLIQEFCSKFLTEKYDEKIQSIYLYNPPAIISVLRSMFSPFISANIRSKIIEC